MRFAILFIILSLPFSDFASASQRYYMLSKPVTIHTEIGKVGQVLHYGMIGCASVIAGAICYRATGEPVSALTITALEMVRRIPYVTVNPTIDLKLRGWLKMRAFMSRLDEIPGLLRAFVLTSDELKYKGIMPTTSDSTGRIFVETDAPLVATGQWQEELGTPIEISNPEKTKVHLRLVIAGHESETSIELTLREVLDRKQLPDQIALAWQKELKAHDRVASKLERYLTKSHRRATELRGTLQLEDGSSIDMGALSRGSRVHKILGLSFWPQFKAFISATLGRGPSFGTGPLPLRLYVQAAACEAKLLEK